MMKKTSILAVAAFSLFGLLAFADEETPITAEVSETEVVVEKPSVETEETPANEQVVEKPSVETEDTSVS